VNEMLEKLEKLKYWSEVSYTSSAKSKRKKSENPKPICPFCEKYYLRACYIKVKSHEKTTPKWIKIGQYCVGCETFIPIKEC